MCPPYSVRPAGCIEPPLKSIIIVYSDGRDSDGDALPGLVRAVWNLTPAFDAVPLSEFPSTLMQADEEGHTTISVRLVIAADDSVSDCRVVKLSDWSKSKGERVDLPDNQGLGAIACQLIRQHGKFLHGVDRGGKPVGGPTAIGMRFDRHRYEAPMPPPPLPPGSWIGGGYGHWQDWPPSYLTSIKVRFAEPRWSDYLADRNKLLKAVSVGIALSFDNTGAVTGCAVKAPSGDQRLDEASCAALRTVRNEDGSHWPLRDFPVLVQWRGHKAELVPARPAVLPTFTKPLLLAASDLPHAELPKYTQSRLRLAIDSAGVAQNCEVVASTGDDAFDARGCNIALERLRFTGGKDIFGRPAIGGMYVRVDWKDLVITGPSAR